MKSNNILEINGRFYDAKTGLPLVQKAKQALKTVLPTTTRSVDGFSPQKSRGSKQPASKQKPQPVKRTIAVSEASPKKSTALRTPSPNIRLKNSRSLTLNRKAVKKPVLAVKEKTASPQPSPAATKPSFKHAQQNERFERAKLVNRSSAIARFSNHVKKQAIELTPKTIARPLTTRRPVAIAPAAPTLSTKERLISQAVTKAALQSDHKAKHKHHHKFHVTRYVTSGLVGVLLAGYVAYLNVPSISMKVAAHRAGFAAALPGYQPSGYSFSGPIAYSPGQVTVNFSSNTDNRKFSLKQQPTTWDSAALLENFVTRQNSNYLTYQDRGLTIYIYDGSSAAWVNGGKMYHLEGKNSQLDTDQLLKLATSV